MSGSIKPVIQAAEKLQPYVIMLKKIQLLPLELRHKDGVCKGKKN